MVIAALAVLSMWGSPQFVCVTLLALVAAWVAIATVLLVRWRSDPQRPIDPTRCSKCGYARDPAQASVCAECGEYYVE